MGQKRIGQESQDKSIRERRLADGEEDSSRYLGGTVSLSVLSSF